MQNDAYPDQSVAYVVFTSLGDDKRSECRLQQEVNTVVPANSQSSCIGRITRSPGPGRIARQSC